MKIKIANLTIIFAAAMFFLSTLSCASTLADENHTLHIYVSNKTLQILSFNYIHNSKPGNIFYFNPLSVKPGEEMVITVEKLQNNDIMGLVYLTDDNGSEIPFFILDREQIHFGQSVFNVTGDKYYSTLSSLTPNKNVGPRYLMYLEARVHILPRSQPDKNEA